jgi:hypothetical protein
MGHDGVIISYKATNITGSGQGGPFCVQISILIWCYILVGGFNHLEKYQSMGRILPYIMENKKCSKPPTSIYI